LPCYSRSDKDIINGLEQVVSCENSMGVIQLSKGVLKPIPDQFLSETQIICRLAKETMGNRTKVAWVKCESNYDHVRDLIAKVIPGCEDYNKKIRKPGGFYLPNDPREGKFKTEKYGDKAAFSVVEVPEENLEPDDYIMMSIRSHDQFNTTIYGLEDRYRGIHNERRVIFMNPKDIALGGFQAGEKVDLFNYGGGVARVARLFVIVPYNIPERNTATYYPETNVLVPIDSVAIGSNTPVSKRVIIKIRKHTE